MEKKIVITIGRQYGSGGREVGIQLAKLLNIGYYDKRLITEAARKSGLSSQLFEQKDEKFPGPLTHALSFGMIFKQDFSTESLFQIQADVITEIAAKESCVIVGRCTDYILRNNPMCFNIFVHSPAEVRTHRIMARKKINRKEAVEMMNKTDKARATYYNFYTDKQWGHTTSYHISVDSSVMGIENTVKYLKEYILAAIAAKQQP